MLKNFIFNFKFFRYIQSNLFVDYILKKIIEIFVKNILIYTSLFFGEKFIIEYLTKKIFSYYIVFISNSFSLNNFTFSNFFLNIIIFLLLLLNILNIFFFF
jgi:hypothetical protein